jgi:hypothetical protein
MIGYDNLLKSKFGFIWLQHHHRWTVEMEWTGCADYSDVFVSFLSRKELIKAKREAADVYAIDTFSPNCLYSIFLFSC